ncbi:cation diffusion facilitator CzcD-associated flavoprotein CzcO [Actinomadura pelletieri DSM 43383]|uniref:Cation diffusion facilitator CzcD-associated flavoprotein CzcO n=1 Tax=Actinomadura pelletieri DSM 43383 TaxID=1120940 RepID=A0A495QY84_9ACTN|nr:NAD(P)/FAD-dependent oxidoreductase [Actinomadura pelletieri]RKS78984.1 cation diffusion facilitator CzcD-associated flavoprotein CzcO [Actinomadura pelletieri DSM 43383]
MRRTRGPRVAIIGCGFGGIAAAVKLKKKGLHHFTVFEQSDGPGGTWWDNRYPGCEVDIASHAYSFSFLTYDWTRTHAGQEELQRYAEHVVDRFDVRRHCRFGVRVESATWDAEKSRYDLRLAGGEVEHFDVVISCLGLLNQPRYPDWPGLDDFQGPKFHTARWETEHDLTGKRVAVVGTGSTATQIVPAIAEKVEKLYVFQRQPGWILPKGERDYTPRERMIFQRFPFTQKLRRLRLFYQFRVLYKGYDLHGKRQQQNLQACRDYIRETIQDPELRTKLTPDYPWGCKRPVLATGFYPALNRPNVELVPHAVTRMTPTGIVDATETERDIDVLVMATGFHATKFLASLDVRGTGGVSIHDTWKNDPKAFLGITVPGYPNFFMLYGPNTNGGFSVIAQLERQAEVAARTVARMRRKRLRAVDTRPTATDRWVRWVDAQIVKHTSAMEANCTNYYHAESGRNVTQWPKPHGEYYLATRTLPFFGFVEQR